MLALWIAAWAVQAVFDLAYGAVLGPAFGWDPFGTGGLDRRPGPDLFNRLALADAAAPVLVAVLGQAWAVAAWPSRRGDDDQRPASTVALLSATLPIAAAMALAHLAERLPAPPGTPLLLVVLLPVCAVVRLRLAATPFGSRWRALWLCLPVFPLVWALVAASAWGETAILDLIAPVLPTWRHAAGLPAFADAVRAVAVAIAAAWIADRAVQAPRRTPAAAG